MPCSQNAVWCFGNTPWMLSGEFLIAWGAKWGPLMRRQPWRFVTSWFIHESFMHVLSNMLLFLVVACQVRALHASSALRSCAGTAETDQCLEMHQSAAHSPCPGRRAEKGLDVGTVI